MIGETKVSLVTVHGKVYMIGDTKCKFMLFLLKRGKNVVSLHV